MTKWSLTPSVTLLPQTTGETVKQKSYDGCSQETHESSSFCGSCFRFFVTFFLTSLVFLLGVKVGSDQANVSNGINLGQAHCFFPIGGGEVPSGGALPQAAFTDELCIAARKKYFEKGKYDEDTTAAYATGAFLLEETVDYNKMVIFDIDETVLSNVPFYGQYGYARVTGPLKAQWQNSSAGPVIPASLTYYKGLREKGYSISFITGRHEPVRPGTVKNLENAGFGVQCAKNPAPAGEICYHQLILRTEDDHRDATIYKSEARKSLQDQNFTLVAGIGDQWSDLFGTNRPPVILKIPNPMYYIF